MEQSIKQKPFKNKFPLNPDTEKRIDELIGKMTLDKKIAQTDMLSGAALKSQHPASHVTVADDTVVTDEILENAYSHGGGFVHDIYAVPKIANAVQRYFVEKTRLGIPVIFTGEALHGICRPDGTIFPTPIAMAAGFDRKTLEEVGAAIAAESRSFSITEIFIPNLDIAREIRWGRVEETFGEDTYLASELGYSMVYGAQGDDVSDISKTVVEPKHYGVHGIAEGGHNTAPAIIGRRMIETEHLPSFKAAVTKAGAYNAMASYNSIDGETVISSKYYLDEILNNRWGMRGYVRSDFGAVTRLKGTHFTAETDKEAIRKSLEAGLCVQGFDYSSDVWRDTIKELIQQKELDISVLNNAVRRILRVKFDLGLFDNPYIPEDMVEKTVRCKKHLDTALKSSRQSITLLKNDGMLPLEDSGKTVAVVGPSSNNQYVGDYSPTPYTYEPESVYNALKKAMPNTRFIQESGCAYTRQEIKSFPDTWFKNGVSAKFYANADFSGNSVARLDMKNIAFDWIASMPVEGIPFRDYSVIFEADIDIDLSYFTSDKKLNGNIIFRAADTFKLYIDDQLILDSAKHKDGRFSTIPFEYVNGQKHKIRLEFVCDKGGGDVSLNIGYTNDDFKRAMLAVDESDEVVVVCGEDWGLSGEGKDRAEISLDKQQLKLITAIIDTGKPITLLVQSGRPVDLHELEDNVNAIIHSFFAGDFGGQAAAEAIAGEFSPAGRLPVSFPLTIGHIPSYYSRVRGRYDFDYCDMSGANLYDFGHGLSYTQFEYSELKVENNCVGDEIDVKVSVNVKNIGNYDSDEVVQLYICDKYASVALPEKLLKDFKRVHIGKGQTQTMSFDLGFDAFKLFNLDYEWVVERGEFVVMVGAGSQDIRLIKTIKV